MDVASEILSDKKSWKKEENNGSFSSAEFNLNGTFDMLNDSCASVQDICGQETWIMTDGSYITRLQTEFFYGTDVNDFLIIQEDLCT